MRIEWLVTDVIARRSPERAERAIWGRRGGGGSLGIVLANSGRIYVQRAAL